MPKGFGLGAIQDALVTRKEDLHSILTLTMSARGKFQKMMDELSNKTPIPDPVEPGLP
jgi:hypothetical protein